MMTLTAQKAKFSIKDFFSKCDKIHRKLQIWSHLLKKPLIEKFVFSAATNLDDDDLIYIKIISSKYLL